MFECEPSRVFNIQRVLESKYNAAVIEAEDQLEPHELVMVDPELRLQINTLVDRLRERCEYIIRVFDNICEPELETTADQSRA
ncbi:unnamed protein product [Protopolystoma xenopodis]|uniref:Uncharacterized protein n=1 Tax=Protopolystoma xenopodis TaxID=117903 RepID=A0A448WCJ8_9PLAT|nr:unnamed protein product [Protopolystoma xenopodis]